MHALRMVTSLGGVGPDAVVGFGVDAGFAAVEDEGDEGLRDAELFGELGLRDFFRGARHAERFNNYVGAATNY